MCGLSVRLDRCITGNQAIVLVNIETDNTARPTNNTGTAPGRNADSFCSRSGIRMKPAHLQVSLVSPVLVACLQTSGLEKCTDWPQNLQT